MINDNISNLSQIEANLFISLIILYTSTDRNGLGGGGPETSGGIFVGLTLKLYFEIFDNK